MTQVISINVYFQQFINCLVDIGVKRYYMGIIRQIAEYLYLKKKAPDSPHTQWLKYMHGINRISIFMFLTALIIMLVKLLFFRHR